MGELANPEDHVVTVRALCTKRAEVAYQLVELERRQDQLRAELAERLKEHGLSETRNSIAAKLKRGTFPATFLLAVMTAIGLETVNLADI